MKIVHISYKDDQEGAAIAVDRVCSALIRIGVDSKILVQKKISDKPYARSVAINKPQKIFALFRVGLDLLINNLLVKDKSTYFTFPFIGADISQHPFLLEADVIHIHWVNRGFLSLRSIGKILKLNKPVPPRCSSHPTQAECKLNNLCVWIRTICCSYTTYAKNCIGKLLDSSDDNCCYF